MWIQEGFTAETLRNDSGANLGEMIRASAQKSELQAKSRRNRIAQKRNPNGVQVLLQKTNLKAFLSSPKENAENADTKTQKMRKMRLTGCKVTGFG